MKIDTHLLKNPIFKIAFTHRSFLNESDQKLESNERLEFLGDSILAFIVSSTLYNLRPQDTEGDLTNLRSFIVKTGSLTQAAKKLNLGRYLKLSKGEELSGGRENAQILANTYEAVVGAIFVDQGLEKAQEFIAESLLPLFEEQLKSGPPKDSKSLLQELSQEKFRQSPRYRVLVTSGPDHAKKFRVGVFIAGKKKGEGVGFSKQIAEEHAASEALNSLGR